MKLLFTLLEMKTTTTETSDNVQLVDTTTLDRAGATIDSHCLPTPLIKNEDMIQVV